MLVTALLAICCSVAGSDTPAAPAKTPAPAAGVTASPSVIADNSRNLPDAPVAKSSAASVPGDTSSSEDISGAQPLNLNSAVKPATRSYETARQKKIWYGLVATGHGAAVFDAWSTRRALSGGYGTEADPLLRPFAHSGAIYAATQVSPLVMDYLGYRMIRSNHSWMRKMWWVPQVAGTSVSLSAGFHNYRLYSH